MSESKLKEEIRRQLNMHSRENVSDTADFVLAEYLMDCLEAYEKASNRQKDLKGR